MMPVKLATKHPENNPVNNIPQALPDHPQCVRAGKLGAVKLGGEWRIRAQDLMAFIEAALPLQERQSCHPPLPA